jgi:hypothetical protein
MYPSSEQNVGTPQFEQEKIEIKKFETSPAHVMYSNGATISMGNYESAKVEIGVTLPVYMEEIDEAFKVAEKIVNERLDKEVTNLKALKDKRNSAL